MATDGLPDDWKVVPFGSVFRREALSIEVEAAERYREIGIRSHGKGVFHKEEVVGASLGSKRVFEVVPGALAMNIVFAWEGAVAVVSESERGMIASHRFPMYVPCGEVKVDVEFIRRFFQTKRGVELLGDASPGGAGRNRTLNQKFAAEMPLPIPPIAEQRKIAAILLAVDEAIEATQAVIDQLHVVKKAVMDELLTRGLPRRHTQFQQSEIGEYPKSWSVVRIGDLLEESAYGTSAKCDTSGNGYPVLRIPNVVMERVSTDDLKYASLRRSEVDAYRLRPGDLLVIRTNGNPAYVGRSAVVPELQGVWLYASYLIRLRVKSHLVLPAFLHEAMRSERTRKTMQGAIRTSAGNYNLNTQGIVQTLVPLPPLDEQCEITVVARIFEERLDAESAALAALRTIKAALMSVLLTGEVRVRPDKDVV